MKTLIKLELRKNNIRSYFMASFVIAIVMLGFLYLFAYAPMLEPDDKDMAIFSGYSNLIPLFSALNMAVFCVLSAVMYSKFFIEEYSGKRSFLLFSYPVKRTKIVLSKLCLVSIFSIIVMIASNIFIFILFGITENIFSLVNENFTFSVMIQAIQTTVVMSFIAASIGIVSLGIGFVKKSVPTTIVSSVLIASLVCNIVVYSSSNDTTIYPVAFAMFFMGLIATVFLIKKVNLMEVE